MESTEASSSSPHAATEIIQDSPNADLTLGQLLEKSIDSADQVFDAPSPNDSKVQSLTLRTISDLTFAGSLIRRLSLLSPNETLEDLNTPDLRCLLVEALVGQLELLVRTKGTEERKARLTKAQSHLHAYLTLCDSYDIMSTSNRQQMFSPESISLNDPGRRRQTKIARFKMEKELKEKLKELKSRLTAALSSSNSSSTATLSSSIDLPPEIEDHLRPLLLSLLALHYLKAHAELDSIDAELDILKNAIPTTEPGSERERDGRERSRGVEEDRTWRLDSVDGVLGKGRDGGRLLDDNGKVLRNFTILPSHSSHSTSLASSTRLRLQSEVFQSSHRLPTMSIDEFIDSEFKMGNVLQGGGAKSSEDVLREKEEKEMEGEEDNLRGYEMEEGGLREKRDWDEWAEEHPRGSGNRLNRG